MTEHTKGSEKDSLVTRGGVKKGVAQCLGTHGLNLSGVKKNHPHEIAITSGKTTINFKYGSRQNLKKELFERIVARLDALGCTDLKTATVEKSDLFFHELVFSDIIAEQHMVLVHFQFIDISIGYFSPKMSYAEVADMATRLNDTVVSQGVNEMGKSNNAPKFDILAQENRQLLIDFIVKFQQVMEIAQTASIADGKTIATYMERNEFADIIAAHYMSPETESWNQQKRAQNLTGRIVKAEDSAEAIFYRHYSLVGVKACIGYVLGTKGRMLYEKQCNAQYVPVEPFDEGKLVTEEAQLAQVVALDANAAKDTNPQAEAAMLEAVSQLRLEDVPPGGILGEISALRAKVEVGRYADSVLKRIAEMGQYEADAAEYARLATAASDMAKEIAASISPGDTEENLKPMSEAGAEAQALLVQIRLLAEVPSK